MNTEEFRKYAKCVIDYICDYRDNISTRNVAPTLDPGYLRELVPDKAPVKGEEFKKILEDVETKIMPGVVHWNHPQFFAYFPSGNSYPSVIADLITSAIGSVGFSWASNPAGTELETIVLDWYAKALDLPSMFLSDHPGSRGGGSLQGSASECALVCMIAARARAIKGIKGADCEQHDSLFLSQLVAYASKEAHSSIEKAAKMAMVKLRILDTDHRGRLRIDALKEAIRNDSNSGLTPFFVVATVGTTGACAFDKLSEIGKVCREFRSIWFHVDGAYAGNAFILPEMRQFSKGLEYADSFNTNPNKLLLTNFDASALWVKDIMLLKTALTVDPLYLQHEHSKAIDYRHYGIPLSRRFRALKLWLVFRSYGIIGLQSYIRNHITLAKKFEALVKEDARFEIRNDVYLGLVCFRLRSSDEINQELLALINHSGKMHMIPAMVRDKYVIRFCVTYEHAKEEHISDAWKQIQYFAEEVLKDAEIKPDAKKPMKKLTRTLSNRFAFTRSVSLEVYERQNSHLTDGCTPIVVLDQDDIIASLNRATRLNLEGRNIDPDSAEELSN